MWIYYTIFFLITIFYYQTQYKAPDKKYLVYIMLALGIFVGFGDMLGGYDRYVYCDLFDGTADATMSGTPYRAVGIWGYSNEIAYVYLNIIISHITANRYIFVFIVTMIIYVMLLLAIKKYIDNYPFALLLFLGLWFFFTFTYLRQCLAVCVVWFGYRYVVERKLWKYLAIVVLAYCFHNSAIIFVPVYFIPVKKYSPSFVIAVMVGAFLIGASGAPSALFDNFGDISGTSDRTEAYAEVKMFRIDYVIEAVLFLYIILMNYRKIPETKQDIVFLNMGLLFCGTLLFFVNSTNAGRLGWYFLLGIIYTLSKIEIQSKQKMDYFLIVILMFFLFNRILTAWDILLSPYKTFLTDGHRDNDKIFLRFEYDEKYDKDKFYRPAFILFGNNDDNRNSSVQ